MAITHTFDEYPEDYEPSDELAELFQAAFDSALDSLEETDSLIPMLIEQSQDQEFERTAFADMREEDALQAATDRLAKASSDIVAYTFAYLAELVIDDEDETAHEIVVVEGGERSMDYGYRVVQILDGEDDRVLYHGHCPKRLM